MSNNGRMHIRRDEVGWGGVVRAEDLQGGKLASRWEQVHNSCGVLMGPIQGVGLIRSTVVEMRSSGGD